ncbi:MAG TPA: efflux RND transporter permease subunit [Phycisphaerae bacterium]|nr:efflux RND transporter permease subunit [Phycisphaerae bacterium]HRW53258.1 efflux RND transporter permease subunit [Phycisphaerae bacterium]
MVDLFIRNPVKVAVGVILLVLFGALTVIPPSIMPSPIRAPVQLTPNIDEPVVMVQTRWEGASPEEVEREILDKQEDMLKSISNLRKMIGTTKQGESSVRLEFEVGTDKDIAKQDVSDALRRVQYQIPQDEFDNPIVTSGEEDGDKAIAWMILSSDRNDVSVPELFTFVDEEVIPFLERVEGVASVRLLGGRDREIQVVVDPYKLAQAGITFAELSSALQTQNTNIAAGNSAQGKRDVVIRTMGRFSSLQDVRETVVRMGDGGPIRVRDVADVVDGFKRQYTFVRSKGKFVMALPAYRETNANVIETMEGLRAAITRVNNEILSHRGLTLELTQVYDETTYIHSSIGLVQQNILLGGALAIVVLMLFLRSISGTFVVALSIPISVIGTLLVIPVLGRNINVVMLAGLAFAVGMVVDNAIVVLENIFRHREMGKSAFQAASDGASEVWGAVVANSLTTMIVFLPILFVQEEAGQLFRDIAIAISGAVALSLVVSVTVIPTVAARVLGRTRGSADESGGRFAHFVGALVHRINKSVALRLGVVVGMTALSIVGSYAMAPTRSYLPAGNRNLVFGFLLAPPGYNTLEYERMASVIENGDPTRGIIGVRAFWEAKAGTPEFDALLGRWSDIVENQKVKGEFQPQIDQAQAILDAPDSTAEQRDDARKTVRQKEREIREWRVPPPPIENFFYVDFNGTCFMGCSSADEENVRPLVNVLTQTGGAITDVFPYFFQSSIFNMDKGNTVEVEVRSDSLETVVPAATQIQMAAMQEGLGYAPANPSNYNRDQVEDQIIPDRVRAGDVGMTVSDLGFIIRACGDGRTIGQYREGGRSIDLAIKVKGVQDQNSGDNTTRAIADIPIFTPTGHILPMSSVCRIDRTTAPQEIQHIETQPAVKLTVSPPDGVSLENAITTLENKIIGRMRGEGYGPAKMKIPDSVTVNLAGNADKLSTTFESLKWLLALSFLIVFLLMAGLFESFAYPFVIILTVPLAVVGGFVGLWIVNLWTYSNPTMAIQELDVLTILGFVILLGIVVNNGILIVHQSINFVRDGMAPNDAIAESVRTRIRPIFMTVMTTFFGQLMLVIRPGSGAELYRGVGAVVLGGLLVSTVFTLVVVPAMLSLFMSVKGAVGHVVADTPSETTPTGAIPAMATVGAGEAPAPAHASTDRQ